MKNKVRNARIAAWFGVGLVGCSVLPAKAAVVLTDANEYVGADSSDVNVLTILLALGVLATILGVLSLFGYWLIRKICLSRCEACEQAEEEIEATEQSNESDNLQFPKGQGYNPTFQWSFQNALTQSSKRPLTAGSGTGSNVSE